MSYKYIPNFTIKKKTEIKNKIQPKLPRPELDYDPKWYFLAFFGLLSFGINALVRIPFVLFYWLKYIWSGFLNIIQFMVKMLSPNYRNTFKQRFQANIKSFIRSQKSYFNTIWNFFRYTYMVFLVVGVTTGLKVLSLNSSYVYKESFFDKAIAKVSYLKYDSTNFSKNKKISIETLFTQFKQVPPYRKYKVVESENIQAIADKFEIKKETITYNNNMNAGDEVKPEQELLIPWQDVYMYSTEDKVEIKKLASTFQVDENLLYSKNEGIVNKDDGTIPKDSLVYIPLKDINKLGEFKKELDREKEKIRLAKIEENYKKQLEEQKKLQEEQRKTALATQTKLGTGANYGNNYGGQSLANGGANSVEANSAGFIWPARGSITRCIEYSHNGCDIANRSNPPIYAASSGVVSAVYYYSVWGYGNAVVIDHGGGLKTLYAHMLDNSITVVEGQAVSQGEVIGTMGSTGNSTGTHLHFEVRANGVNQNPLAYLP